MRMDRRRFLLTSAVSAPALGAACGSAAQPERSAVRPGADVLAEQGWNRLRGHKVGMITNPTGVLSTRDRYLVHQVDEIHASGGIDLVAVFGAEHGFRGTSQAGGSEGNYADPRTGLPVYDTYGAKADQIAGMFRKAGVDLVVFDIADVGARFYTYIWTMYTAMQAAADVGAGFLVLDRPNPLGDRVAGPRLDPRFASFIGMLPIVQQHGMTAGELARMFRAQYLNRPLQLDVVPVQGWSRQQRFPETGLPWVPPSPNMPTPHTADVYPGTGLFEGTVLSEGRGTANPLETVGAVGIDWRWAEKLNTSGLPGVRFRETYFSPTTSKFQGQTCGGVQLYRTGEDFDPIATAVTMLVTARELFPAVFGWKPGNDIDELAGTDRLRTMVNSGAPAAEILGSWRADADSFRRQRAEHLLYR
jgi:uncharacterized protein YbbC (DUF1343 family)